MVYYKAKKQKAIRRANGSILMLVQNELFTQKELLKKVFLNSEQAKKAIETGTLAPKFFDDFEKIETPKNNTYWFFGARHTRED